MKIICIAGKARCVDGDTEYFNGYSWVKIRDYRQNDNVLVYHEDGSATLELPNEYIVDDCDEMIRFSNKRLDQCLTEDHSCCYITSKGYLAKKSLRDLINQHIAAKNGFSGRFITTFSYNGPGVELSDDEIRLMCAVIADSSFIGDSNKCYMNLKKQRKKDEIRRILNSIGIDYTEKEYPSMPGYTRFLFNAPRREKEFSEFWYGCSKHQLQVVCESVPKWDGRETKNGFAFSSTSLASANFVQFAASACGLRASIQADNRIGGIHKSICYTVIASKNTLVSLFNRHEDNRDTFKPYKTVDGKCYCFNVSTGMLVLRRNNKIFITGNSGKDSTANCLKKSLESDGYSVLIAHYGDLVKYFCRTYFGWDGNKDAIGRTLLQQVGTDTVRAKQPNYWVDFLKSVLILFPDEWDYVLIPDCRFPNEVEAMRELFDTKLIRVTRPDFESPLTEEQQNHPSETALDGYPADYYITNAGTLADLQKMTAGLVFEMNGIHQYSFDEL